jgi:hypothetical protein
MTYVPSSMAVQDPQLTSGAALAQRPDRAGCCPSTGGSALSDGTRQTTGYPLDDQEQPAEAPHNTRPRRRYAARASVSTVASLTLGSVGYGVAMGPFRSHVR